MHQVPSDPKLGSLNLFDFASKLPMGLRQPSFGGTRPNERAKVRCRVPNTNGEPNWKVAADNSSVHPPPGAAEENRVALV